ETTVSGAGASLGAGSLAERQEENRATKRPKQSHEKAQNHEPLPELFVAFLNSSFLCLLCLLCFLWLKNCRHTKFILVPATVLNPCRRLRRESPARVSLLASASRAATSS